MEIKIGADPELFVRDAKTGKYLCAHGMVEGTKDKPQPVKYGAMQVDGMALEFNIDPAKTVQEFETYITHVREQMLRYINPEHDVIYDLDPTPTCYFDQEYFDGCPKQAKDLGCNPDWNAWTETQNERPYTDQPFRTGAGHLHIGFTEGEDITDPDFIQECYMVVKQLDVCVGMYSLLWDGDVKRRTLYGTAGSCRIKPYGVEYRPLSNAWLKSPQLIRWVFKQTKGAVDSLSKGFRYFEEYGDMARTVINSTEPQNLKTLSRQLKYLPMSEIQGIPLAA
jgi:hypothetical protein